MKLDFRSNFLKNVLIFICYLKSQITSTIGNTFWPITAYAKKCEDREKIDLNRVTQVTCQDACIETGEDCAGITCTSGYYYKDHYDCSGDCYACKNTNMVDGDGDMDVFIKKPGNL